MRNMVLKNRGKPAMSASQFLNCSVLATHELRMSRKVYNKLVRDKIPEIIRADGKKLKTRVLSDEEHLEALLAKVEEELKELREAKNVEELADLHEVLL